MAILGIPLERIVAPTSANLSLSLGNASSLRLLYNPPASASSLNLT